MASTIETNVDNGVLTITCAGEIIVVNPADFASAIRDAATLHGFKQKIVDAAALSRNADTGASATAQDKLAAMRDVVHQLSMGDWNRRATGDGSGAQGLLVTALMRLTGKSADEVGANVSAWTPEQQAAMRASPQVAPIIATIKAERAAARPEVAKIDAGALLASVMGNVPVADAPKAKAKKVAHA